jgi:hypothetical protein
MKFIRSIAVVVLGGLSGLMLASPAQAAPEREPRLPNDLTTPVTERADLTIRSAAPSEVASAATRSGAQGWTEAQLDNIGIMAVGCWTAGYRRWAENISGGTLYQVEATINWCSNGTRVYGGSASWSTYTNFGWSFNSWSNPPNNYYNPPSNTQFHTVGQAKFCLGACWVSETYLGFDLWGTTAGTIQVQHL